MAEAKGWALREAAERTLANFKAFYQGQLPGGMQ